LNLLERLEQRPLKVRPKEDYERIVRGLSETELESMMDLRPFMQRNPFVVQADANLSRTYRLFRTMGLRHLFVGPPQPKVLLIVFQQPVTVVLSSRTESVCCHSVSTADTADAQVKAHQVQSG